MENKMNFYGYELGVLLNKSDDEFDFYQNNKELDFGFYNEDNGFFVEKDYKTRLKQLRNYVDKGVNGTYCIISYQGKVDHGSKEYKDIINEKSSIDNMIFDFFKNSSLIEYSICKKDGKIIEYFLEDANKTYFAKNIKKDISIEDLNITERAKYALKASGLLTLKQLLEMPLSDIQNIRNLGNKGFYSIKEELSRICCQKLTKMDSLYKSIAIDFDGETLFIAEETSSGCKYKVSNKQEMIQEVCNYIADCLDQDNEYEILVTKK